MARSFLGPDSGDADGDAPPPATARLLFATPEPWPTFRADVAVLFGKYLPRFGVATDLVAERAPGTDGAGWGGGRAYLASTGGGKARRQLATFVHCVRMLMRADPRECRALQVRDMPFVAAFGVLAARWKKLPFFYWMSFPLPEAQVKLARARGMSAGLARFLSPWVRGHAGLVVLYRFVLPLADHVFVQSEWMLREVASKGIAPERMTAVPMGVDLEAARPEDIAPSDDPRIAGRPLVVYLGVLYRDRGIDLLFEMLQRVRARFPDVLLALVGQAEDEQHEEWLRERAAQLGVAESVVWTGWLPVEEAWRYVRAAHVGLSPIPRGPLLDQASPTKVLEYLALGLAVVASDLPDQKLVLEESGGGICVALSAENLADAVCELLADPQRRSDMARRGRAYVRERRSYRQLAQALAEKYGTLVHPDAEGRLQAAAVTPRRP